MPSHSPDEQSDLNLVASYLDDHGLNTERYSREETQRGPTPDFKVKRNGQLVAYCEVKSPNDPWLDDLLDSAPPETIVGGARPDPIFNRLSRHILTAGRQFAAVNQSHSLLNILAYVNHDSTSHFGDLQETLTGHFHADDGVRILTMPHIPQRLGAVRDTIDAYLWFCAKDGRLTGAYINQVDPSRSARTCALIGIEPSSLQQ